jgi:uncharacterized membrane protein YeaQ/YmgE (transglycosylase-associated protein family)
LLLAIVRTILKDAMFIGFFMGILVGALARFFMPRKYNLGCILTGLLGMGGSFVTWLIGHYMHWYGDDEKPGIILSIVGTMLVLWAWDKFRGTPPPAPPSS